MTDLLSAGLAPAWRTFQDYSLRNDDVNPDRSE